MKTLWTKSGSQEYRGEEELLRKMGRMDEKGMRERGTRREWKRERPPQRFMDSV